MKEDVQTYVGLFSLFRVEIVFQVHYDKDLTWSHLQSVHWGENQFAMN